MSSNPSQVKLGMRSVATRKTTNPVSLPLPVVGVWDGPLVPTTYGALSVYHYTKLPLRFPLVCVAANNQVTLRCRWYTCHTQWRFISRCSHTWYISLIRLPSLKWSILFPLTTTQWSLQIDLSLFTSMEPIWSGYLSIQTAIQLSYTYFILVSLINVVYWALPVVLLWW